MQEEEYCRICMETSQPLIHPCRCSGSLKHIHESCLKTWLASKIKDIENARCEICHTEFLMEFLVSSKCTPLGICKVRLTHCIFVPLLLIVLCLLTLIVAVITRNLIEGRDSDKGYAVTLLITCSFSSLVLILLLVNALKEACFKKNLLDWRIFSQEFENYVQTDNDVVENQGCAQLLQADTDKRARNASSLYQQRRVYPVNLGLDNRISDNSNFSV